MTDRRPVGAPAGLAASAVPGARRWQRRRRARDAAAAYAFLLPWLLGLLVLTLGPLAASFYLSLTSFDLLGDPSWVGLDNYREMARDPRFWAALRVSFTFVVLAVPLKLLVALGLALLLHARLRGATGYRAVLYLPSLLGASVAVALLWQRVFAGDGLFTRVLAVFGLHGPSWVSDPRYALGTLVVLAVWQFGSPMIVFLAGLGQIPPELHEAAGMDGAGRWRRFRRITLPMLTPVVFFNLVFQTIDALKAFTQAYVVSGGTGGPTDSTLFFTLYLYQEAFANLRMGYASALAWVLVTIIAGLTAVMFLSQRFWVHYNE